jgi:hypothetical protein
VLVTARSSSCSSSSFSHLFICSSVVEHIGTDSTVGHYVTYLRDDTADEVWWLCDDVEKYPEVTTWERVMTVEFKLLFYSQKKKKATKRKSEKKDGASKKHKGALEIISQLIEPEKATGDIIIPILGHDYEVKGSHVKTMQEGGWIAASLMDAFLASIEDKYDNDTRSILMVPCAITTWYSHGQNLHKQVNESDEEYEVRHRAKMNKNIDKFIVTKTNSRKVEFEWIFFPIYANWHWRMVAFSKENNSVQLYDSFHSHDHNTSRELESVVQVAQRMFPDEHFDSWLQARETPESWPKQNDTVSCGFYAVNVANTLLSRQRGSAYSGRSRCKDREMMAMRERFVRHIKVKCETPRIDEKWFFADDE